MYYSTVYVGMDVHKENFLSAVTQTRRNRQNTHRKSKLTTVRLSTIWRLCVSITGTMCFSYAVMRQVASGLRCIMS